MGEQGRALPAWLFQALANNPRALKPAQNAETTNAAVPKWDGSLPGVDDPNRHAELIRLSEWGCRPIRWLWEPLIPRRKVTLLVGEQEKGKTFFAADLAARLSRGESIPPAGRLDEGPGSTLFLSGDDDLDDTLLPRLDDMGADLGRVYALTIDGMRGLSHGRRQIALADSVECLNSAAKRIGDCRLIVIDPITAFLGRAGSQNHTAVRRLLSRLTTLAKVHNAAVLIISHHRKSGAAGVLHRTIGSLAFTVAARVVLTLVDDPTMIGRRLLLPAKMNLRPVEQCPGRAFLIEDGELRWDPHPVSTRPDELRSLVAKGLATADRLLEVASRLESLLAAGPKPSREIQQWATEHRIPRMLLFQAKVHAGIRARHDGRQNRWCWELASGIRRLEDGSDAIRS